MTNQPIGMIDSGVGGLTVLKEAIRQLPDEQFIYVADTANCPYGSRSPHEVKQFVWQMVSFLLKKEIKMLVLACNTATAIFLEELQEVLPIPVIGVIFPGSQKAVAVTKNQQIGVIATEATITSHVYRDTIESLSSSAQVTEWATPRFAPLVESGMYKYPESYKKVERALAPLRGLKLDTLILGCTHYPLLEPQIRHFMGEDIQIVNAGVESVKMIEETLDCKQLRHQPSQTSHDLRCEFYTTGAYDSFQEIGSSWLGVGQLKIKRIPQSRLERYRWKKK